MAKVYVSEYGGLAVGGMQVGQEASLTEYTISLSSVAAVATQAIDAATTIIRIHTDAICSIALVTSTTGAATTTNKRMAANATEYFGVKFGQHVTVISNS